MAITTRFEHPRPDGELSRQRIRAALATARPRPPTLRELADEVGLWPSTVRSHLLWLKHEGVVRYDPKIARGITLVEREEAAS